MAICPWTPLGQNPQTPMESRASALDICAPHHSRNCADALGSRGGGKLGLLYTVTVILAGTTKE